MGSSFLSNQIAGLALSNFAADDQPLDKALDPAQIKILPQIRTASNPGLQEESLRDLGTQMLGPTGQLYPVLVRPDPDEKGRFILIAGERRVRAALLVEMRTIWARVYDTQDPELIERIQRAENTQREAITALEQAQAVDADYKKYKSVERVAEIWGKSIGWVSRERAFLEAGRTSPAAQTAVSEGLTSDKTFIAKLARLEKVDPSAAQAVVEELRTDPEQNTRQLISGAVKGHTVDSFPDRPASAKQKPEGPTEHRRRTARLEGLASELFLAQFGNGGSKPGEAIKALSVDQQEQLMDSLREAADGGRTARRGGLTKAVLQRARRGELSCDDGRLYQTVAFLEGLAGRTIPTLLSLMKQAADSRPN